MSAQNKAARLVKCRSRWCINRTESPKESGWIYLSIGRIRGWWCPDCGEKSMAAKNAKAVLYGKILIAFREAKKHGFTWYTVLMSKFWALLGSVDLSSAHSLCRL
jgi:hypothetical protein